MSGFYRGLNYPRDYIAYIYIYIYIYRGFIGIMEKNMETTISRLGFRVYKPIIVPFNR